MPPSHQHRLPVSKPSYGYRKKKNQHLLASGDAECSTDPLGESNSPTETSGDEFRATVRQSTEPAIRIEVQKQEQRPFELGDLLTREFAARNNSFLISLALHTFMLLILSLFLIHGSGKAMVMLELLSSPDIEQQPGIFTEIDVDFDESDKLVDAISDDLFDDVFGSDDTGGQKLSADGTREGVEGDAQGGRGDGDGKSAKFFGMRATGNKFVYVLDRSGSMGSQTQNANAQFQRFDVARNELMNSVDSLRPHQEFYVVLFSTGIRRMFDDDSLLSRPIKATPENKSRLRNWLSSIRAEGGTDPRKSLNLAFKMKPDAIFMLSDGEFRDENSDGRPRSIEIAKQYVAENPPIQINSIAFEDQRSKVNMQQLADVSGGQFRFVKVNDFLGEMLKSKDERQRLRALQHVVASGLDSWDQKHELALKELIPLLNNPSPQSREQAEQMLHELSCGIFITKISSVAADDSQPQEQKAALDAWTQVWTSANELTSPELSSDLGFFVAMASAFEDDFAKKIEATQIVGLPPLSQIALAERVLDYQENKGLTRQTRQLLLDIFAELNKESTAKFGRDNFLKNASQTTCRARLKKILSNRRIYARRLYRKWEEKKQTEESRQAIASKIIALYPETKYADLMKATL